MESASPPRRPDMSPCWCSEMRRATAAFALLMLVAGSPASAARHGDRVEISDKGVVVVRSGDHDSLDIHRSDDSTTTIDDGGIQVSDHGDALVRVFGDIHVPRGKRVSDDVVAIFGSVDVEGEVDGDVVAVLGTIHVHDGAVVH